MDRARQFLLNLGYSTKQLHGMKAPQKLSIISAHYGCGKLPALKVKHSKLFLAEFFELDEISSDAFKGLFTSFLSKQFTEENKHHQLDANAAVITNLPGNKFYQTPEWRDLRYRTLDKHGNKCFACGRGPKNGVIVHVDHIFPRSIYPEKALDINNMQILCEDCNLGKSNKSNTNWIKRNTKD